MNPGVRKLALSVHVISSVAWIGAVVAYLVLGISSIVSPDTQTVRAAWTAMDVTGWWAIVPLQSPRWLPAWSCPLGRSGACFATTGS
jgi:hypothetical protein